MTEKKTFFISPKLAMAAIVATGMAASPLALSADTGLSMNTAAAQEATDFVDGGAGETRDVHENVFVILGTTPEEVSAEVDQVTADSSAGPLGDYQSAMRDGNLDQAARVLAQASNRLITEKLVLDLNNTLGVESRLTAEQVADAAFEIQDPDLIVMVPYVGDGSDTLQPIDTNTMAFNDYEEAMNSGNLDAAAEALAEATDHPITEGFVLFVNRDLGVESNLTATQVADEAAKHQRAS